METALAIVTILLMMLSTGDLVASGFDNNDIENAKRQLGQIMSSKGLNVHALEDGETNTMNKWANMLNDSNLWQNSRYYNIISIKNKLLSAIRGRRSNLINQLDRGPTSSWIVKLFNLFNPNLKRDIHSEIKQTMNDSEEVQDAKTLDQLTDKMSKYSIQNDYQQKQVKTSGLSPTLDDPTTVKAPQYENITAIDAINQANRMQDRNSRINTNNNRKV